MVAFPYQSGTGYYISLGDQVSGFVDKLGETGQAVATPVVMLARTVATFVLMRAFCLGGLLYNTICIGLHASKNLSLNNPEMRKHAKLMVCDGALLLLPLLIPGGVLIKAAMAIAYGVRPDCVKRGYQAINTRLGVQSA